MGLAFVLCGAAGGFALGLSLRPGAPVQQQQSAQRPAEAPGPPAAVAASTPFPGAAALSQGGLPKSAVFAETPDARAARPAAPAPAAPAPAGDAEATRKSLSAEQARLEALTRARSAAEAQLAQLQEQVAQREQATQREILARREAALASLPSVTAPLPAPSPRQPRPEPAAGAGSGAPPLGAASNAGQQRVVLHHRAGSYAASEAAGAMAVQVRDAGFDLSDTRAVTATPSQRVVRFFHAEDAPAAARLAGRLGRGWALQDFRSYEPLPAPGLLEVWLPDR